MKLLSETMDENTRKERNSRGKVYESEVQSSIEDLGFEYRTGTSNISILAAYRKPTFFREVPLLDTYGSMHKVDFLLVKDMEELVIECKSQTNTTGTTDVKLIEIPLNAAYGYNKDTILAYEGNKFRPKIINFMLGEAISLFNNYIGAFTGDDITAFVGKYFNL